jgi:transcriptional regulator with XRE-family HTH domain
MADAAAADRLPDLRQSQIGSRLRAARVHHGLSLRELGDRIGVSASLISQIERDKVNPSVSSLWALVTELGLTMGEIFDGGGPERREAPAIAFAPALGPTATPETRAVMPLAGGVRWERLTTATDPLVEFVYVVYEVGSTSCPEDSLVRHGGREYGYVISGELGVRIGFDEYVLGPGGSISFDSSAPHRLWNVGSIPVRGIWVVVGRQNDHRASLAPTEPGA